MKIAGISRKKNYSPNHITNDAIIIAKTAEYLRTLGHEVKIYDESYIEKNDIKEKFIFSMAQGSKAINRIREFEKRGACVVNTPLSSLNTYRIPMTRILLQAGIPYPKSIILETLSEADYHFEQELKTKKVWLKRGDVHAEHKEDVTLVYSMDELHTTLCEFKKRGILNAVIQEHLTGQLIKYYGIQDMNFFHWYYLNGNGNVAFNIKELKKLAFKSAGILGVEIFGGDVVVSPDGHISIIDVNDWPSFAPVRDTAAENIAQLINKKTLSCIPISKQPESIHP